MKRSVWNKIVASVGAFLASISLAVPQAFATLSGSGSLQVQDASSLATKLEQLVNSVGIPVGGGILLISVCVAAIELMIARGRPEKRAETMSGLIYIAIGGILLGGALFFAGLFFGIGRSVFGS